MPTPATALYQLDGQPGRADVLEELATMPDRLRAAMSFVPAARLDVPPADGEWSAFRTCCHMRDAALVYSARFRWMVFDDNPLLPNYDEDNWVAAGRDTVDDLPAILDEVAALRADLVRVLERLPVDAWARTGRHEVIGTVDLEAYVRHQVAHERAHMEQIAAATRAGATAVPQ